MITLSPLPHLIMYPHRASHPLVRDIAEALPPTLLALWQKCGKGTFVITNHLSPRYLPTRIVMGGYELNGSLYIPPAGSVAQVWVVVGAWLNHFSGSWALNLWLTEGSGATPTLQEAAERLQPILTRGYAYEHLQTTEPATLLARAVAAYHLAPRDLAFADPQLHKWLKHTLFDESFWQKVSAEATPQV